MMASLVDDVFVDLIGKDIEIVGLGQLGYLRKFFPGKNLSRGVVGCIQDQGPDPASA